MVCVYTKQIEASIKSASRLQASGKKFGYDIELVESVYWKHLTRSAKKENLTLAYRPGRGSQLRDGMCPATRLANGLTHYKLYKWSVEQDEPICIMEHDSEIIGEIPSKAKYDGIIQISSHMSVQWTRLICENCGRANKMRKYQPDFKFVWPTHEGVVRHPLTGINGTSGYIIGPGAASKMAENVRQFGIKQADRLRTEYVGEDNLWLQIPQSVLCYHERIKSHEFMIHG
jgi:hypothetical protein